MSENTTCREFPTADVLSLTTGYLLSSRRMDGVCDLIQWITGTAPFPRALTRRSCRRLLDQAAKARSIVLKQHPWLANVKPPVNLGNADLFSWLVMVEATHGSTLPIAARDPLATLAAVVNAATQAAIRLAAALVDQDFTGAPDDSDG